MHGVGDDEHRVRLMVVHEGLCGTCAQAACERATVRGTTSAALEAADRSVVFSQVWQEKSFTEDVQRSATVNDGSMTMLDSGGEGVGEGNEAMERGAIGGTVG